MNGSDARRQFEVVSFFSGLDFDIFLQAPSFSRVEPLPARKGGEGASRYNVVAHVVSADKEPDLTGMRHEPARRSPSPRFDSGSSSAPFIPDLLTTIFSYSRERENIVFSGLSPILHS